MIIKTTKDFQKSFKTRIASYPNLVKRFDDRLRLFTVNRWSPVLRDHPLGGRMKGSRSFSMNGDIRIVYRENNNGDVWLLDIGSHNQVY